MVTYATVLSSATYLPASERRSCCHLPRPPHRFPVAAPSLSPAPAITATCSARNGTCGLVPGSRRTHRQARCASARLCALPRSRFCCALQPPYSADGFTSVGDPCSPSSARAVAFATSRRRSLGHFAALLLRDLIRLLLALTGLRLRQLQPELSRRFRGYQLPALFRSGLSASLASVAAFRQLPIRLAAGPGDVSLISALRLRPLKLRLERFRETI